MAIEVLDLWQNLVVEVFGSPILFLIGCLFGVLLISAIMRWGQRITVIALFGVSISLSYFIMSPLIALILLIVLSAVGLAYSRFITRG